VAEQPGGDAAQQQAVGKVRGALAMPSTSPRRSRGPARFRRAFGLWHARPECFAIFAILIYLWFRFEWQFALGAMIANVHDIVLNDRLHVDLAGRFDLTSIAALLTILGYSLNDTVVIYDRIRECCRRYKKMPMRNCSTSPSTRRCRARSSPTSR